MAKSHRRRPSLTLCMMVFALIIGAAATAVVVAWRENRLDSYQQQILENVAERRAQAIARLFARALTADWRQMGSLARTLEGASPDELRAQLDLITGGGKRISWAGFARPDGTVVAASAGMLEGRSVAERPWFQRGLEGGFAGDVHDAVLLAQKLPPGPGGAPRRFLDLSTPVPGSTPGVPLGVLGLHINEQWAQDYLAETARILQAEAVIVDRNGTVVLGPDEMVGEVFDQQSMRGAMVGAGGAVLERWPDGREWLTAVAPEVGYGGLPSFGWSLIARIHPATFGDESFRSGTDGWLIAAMLLAGALLAALAFSRLFLNPICHLAESARAISEGEDTYPYETGRTREGATLSGALVRIECRLAHLERKPN